MEPDAEREAALEAATDGAAALDVAALRTLSPEYLAALAEIEALPCNRPGQDKSWVLRAQESRRRFFRDARRALWS